MTGLDVLAREEFRPLRKRRIGLVCNQATVAGDYRHILDLILPLHRNRSLDLKIVLGPQHGLFGHTQDNMIEWEGAPDPRFGVPIASLYGDNRKPTPAMLEGIDLFVIDLPDVGSRYYTFLWTTALCIEACEEAGIEILILDRPNPIGGMQVEGTVMDKDYASFVGLYPLPTRHGMTLGEVANHLQQKYFPRASLSVKAVEEWSRSDYGFDTDAPWAMPSPNMPTIETAVVYPGGCLLEGTNISEGRGTTHPFEIFGAPFLDGWKLGENLNGLELPGCYFRPIQFQPTFQKHAGKICEGCFVHVLDPRAFESVLTYVAILREIRKADSPLAWNPPPYEYEYEKLPIDILAGNSWVRGAIDDEIAIPEIRERFLRECHEFDPIRRAALLYPLGV